MCTGGPSQHQNADHIKVSMQTISRSTMNETKNVIQSLNKNITKLLLTVAVFHDENKITNFNEKLRNTEKPLRWLELKILCL